eukprot:CAMPEP_0181122358 /NCGR_PEP_ID=MMETSP1071-20121207/25267_1 /TAXON_ID=35127 /ORGANISM="Thalassiosira sp., Strain NH16" /LENGTH=357 /DNA_ID=CAMNT_0023207315 /DNA_START=93 /DNA_END=1166 /DNA_ORIENTATION=-
MKLLSVAAVAAVVATAEEKPPSSSSSRHLDEFTTEHLETETRRFIETRLLKRSPVALDSAGGLEEQRKLRDGSTRKERQQNRNGKASKPGWDGTWDGHGLGPGFGHGSEPGHGDWHSGKSGKAGGSWGGSGSRGSGKSGKSGGGSGGWDDDGWSDDDWSDDGGWHGGGMPHKELFYLLPAACPDECISSLVTSSDEMIQSLIRCDSKDDAQLWLVRSDGSYIMIESYDDPGMCIAVDYEQGDDKKMAASTCFNGELVLKPCKAEYGTEWYFTGGQLINTFCWGVGLSSLMTIFINDKKGKLIKECEKDVAVWGAVDEAVLKADTFMFVNHLPNAPFSIDVDEVLDGKEPKSSSGSSD